MDRRMRQGAGRDRSRRWWRSPWRGRNICSRRRRWSTCSTNRAIGRWRRDVGSSAKGIDGGSQNSGLRLDNGNVFEDLCGNRCQFLFENGDGGLDVVHLPVNMVEVDLHDLREPRVRAAYEFRN